MSREFRLQDPGEGIHEAEIVEINVAAGDRVEEDDTVLAVETDKATTELPSPYSGTVETIAVQVGDRVQVGDLLMSFADDPGDASGGATEGKQAASQEESRQQAQRTASGHPEARKAAKQQRGDEADKQPRRDASAGPVPASPSTRRLARELGVVLADVEASGPAGRVLAEDVRGFAEHGPPAKPKRAGTAGPDRGAPEAPAAPEGLPDFSRWGEIERVPLRSVRRATAQAMARAWSEIPHVMHHDLADITELEHFRRGHAAQVEAAGGKLTLTVLVIKAAVAALKSFPRFNASLDTEDDSIIIKHYYHVGVAVDTEQGLLVPVLRDADRKSVVELAVELLELAGRARDGALAPEDMQGGTFTLTNVGGIGGTLFTPIIRHPEAAILGLGRAELQPVAAGDSDDPRLTARLRLPLCLAFDHRINDGADAARFTNHLIEGLADPESLLLSA